MKFELEENMRGASDDDLLVELQRCAKLNGRNTITITQFNEVGKCHSSTFTRRFGSWFNALDAAGLERSRSRLNIGQIELFENIKRMWIALGRQPKYAEVKAPDSTYSAGTYDNKFGGWTKALEAFVLWVNAEDESALDSNQQECLTDSMQQRKKTITKRRTKREISDRQRFRILLQDGFRCCACGASPLKEPNIDLHVDHIIPWSKGGETEDTNLQTKCKKCNLGKGNAFEK